MAAVTETEENNENKTAASTWPGMVSLPTELFGSSQAQAPSSLSLHLSWGQALLLWFEMARDHARGPVEGSKGMGWGRGGVPFPFSF